MHLVLCELPRRPQLFLRGKVRDKCFRFGFIDKVPFRIVVFTLVIPSQNPLSSFLIKKYGTSFPLGSAQ